MCDPKTQAKQPSVAATPKPKAFPPGSTSRTSHAGGRVGGGARLGGLRCQGRAVRGTGCRIGAAGAGSVRLNWPRLAETADRVEIPGIGSKELTLDS